jgi:hypothetical protein
MKQNFTVRQGALDGVEAFLSVAQHRSFRKAAAELGVTPSAISQAVRALESRVGAALFIRTTRSVGLTEAGERFLSRAKPAFAELVAASEVARGLGQRPAGLLRLSVPRAVVPHLLESLIASFCQAYPEVEVEIPLPTSPIDDAGPLNGKTPPILISVAVTPVAYLTAQVTLTLAGFKPGMTVLAPGNSGVAFRASPQNDGLLQRSITKHRCRTLPPRTKWLPALCRRQATGQMTTRRAAEPHPPGRGQLQPRR